MMSREALNWLTGAERGNVLLVGASVNYGPALARAGNAVTVIDPNLKAVRMTTGAWSRIRGVVGTSEELPFDPRLFSAVVSVQNFHTLNLGVTLAECARVLRPQGRIGVAYVIRDDSVPWVKKLKKIVHQYLPNAMTNDQGTASVSALYESGYFPRVDTTSFRLWVPSTRTQLQNSARGAPGADQLDDAEREDMVNEIGKLYDSYARVPDPMMLPYQIKCWRAQVDQSNITAPLVQEDEGLSIAL